MLSLPPQCSQLRELFSVEDLAKGTRSCPTFVDARRSASKMIASDDAIRAVHAVCWRADGRLQLVRFGARGGVKELWTFTG